MSNKGIPIIKRGQFSFICKHNIIEIWLGEPEKSESEYMGGFHTTYLKDVLSGLKAVKENILKGY